MSDQHVSPDGHWRWDGRQWVPNTQPPPMPPRRPSRWPWLVVLGAVLLIGPCFAVAALHPSRPAPAGQTADSATAPVDAFTPTPAPALSNEAVRQAVLNYRPCPDKQRDRLVDLLSAALIADQATAKGTDFIERTGGIGRVVTTYSDSSGTHQAIFDYHYASGVVTGENKLASDVLEALALECR